MVPPSLPNQIPVGSAKTGATQAVASTSAAHEALSTKCEFIACVSLDLDHAPVFEGHAPVHALRELHIVCGDHSGEPRSAHELREGLEDVACRARIEIPGRFVGQQDAWRIGNRTR